MKIQRESSFSVKKRGVTVHKWESETRYLNLWKLLPRAASVLKTPKSFFLLAACENDYCWRAPSEYVFFFFLMSRRVCSFLLTRIFSNNASTRWIKSHHYPSLTPQWAFALIFKEKVIKVIKAFHVFNTEHIRSRSSCEFSSSCLRCAACWRLKVAKKNEAFWTIQAFSVVISLSRWMFLGQLCVAEPLRVLFTPLLSPKLDINNLVLFQKASFIASGKIKLFLCDKHWFFLQLVDDVIIWRNLLGTLVHFLLPQPSVLSRSSSRDDFGDEDAGVVAHVGVVCPPGYAEAQAWVALQQPNQSQLLFIPSGTSDGAV